MKKVIYISWEHLSEKMERDWYISFLLSKGVQIEYWDAASLLLGDMTIPSLLRPYVAYVANYDQLEQMLLRNAGQDVVYVLIVYYESRFYRLFRLLTRYDCKLFFIRWGEFPIQLRKADVLFQRLLRSPHRLFSQVVDRLLTALIFRMGFVKQYDVMFVAGSASMPVSYSKTKLIPFNLCDYDNYLLSRDKGRMINDKYAVFLDINLGYHPDVRISGLKNYIDPNEYMASLNEFFNHIEQKSGFRVVVSAHPSSNYKPTDFNGRTILKGVTPELVKDAEFVISHHSAAISYAVLNKKPLLFIYTDEMNRVYRDTIVSWINDIAGFLHAPLCNINRIQACQNLSFGPIDEESYDRYKYGYLTTRETEGRLNAESFYLELLA